MTRTTRLLLPLAALAALAALPTPRRPIRLLRAGREGELRPRPALRRRALRRRLGDREGGRERRPPGLPALPELRRRVYDVDDSRSSVAVAAGSCVRVSTHGLRRRGLGAPVRAQRDRVLRPVGVRRPVSSMRACRLDRQADCSAAGGRARRRAPAQPQPQPSRSPGRARLPPPARRARTAPTSALPLEPQAPGRRHVVDPHDVAAAAVQGGRPPHDRQRPRADADGARVAAGRRARRRGAAQAGQRRRVHGPACASACRSPPATRASASAGRGAGRSQRAHPRHGRRRPGPLRLHREALPVRRLGYKTLEWTARVV
jgi:hypothetical protein